MLQNLKNKYGNWALITGASSGIGREFAKVLASQNIDLVLVARREKQLYELRNELIAKHKNTVEVIVADLATFEGVNKVLKVSDSKEINILVNNAGVGWTGKFMAMEPSVIQQMVDLNTTAYAITSKPLC